MVWLIVCVFNIQCQVFKTSSKQTSNNSIGMIWFIGMHGRSFYLHWKQLVCHKTWNRSSNRSATDPWNSLLQRFSEFSRTWYFPWTRHKSVDEAVILFLYLILHSRLQLMNDNNLQKVKDWSSYIDMVAV